MVLGAIWTLALAPSAFAGTKVVAGEDKLAITGDDGANDVRIGYSAASNRWLVTIGGGIDSWDGCDLVSATSISCPYTGVIDATSDTGTEGMGPGDGMGSALGWSLRSPGPVGRCSGAARPGCSGRPAAVTPSRRCDLVS